jgi:phage host-nuclease inhibitor protein Gam
MLMAAHHARGRSDDARREAVELRRHNPSLKLKDMEGRLAVFKDRAVASRFIAVLRELGLE